MPIDPYPPTAPTSPDAATPDPSWSGWRGPVLLGLIIFSLALLGILGRPINYTSALWPANPVLAGIMVRHPYLACRPAGWFGAFLGFLAADLLTGSSLLSTLWFTAANMLGAAACCCVFLRASYATRTMQGQHSALVLFVAALSSAVTAATVAAETGPVLFQSELWPNIALWISEESLSYTLLLPVVLALPKPFPSRWAQCIEWDESTPLWQRCAPLLAVLLSVAAALLIGGPGTLSFVVPALLWCALSYSFLVTATLCLIVCLTLTVEVAVGNFQFTPEFWLSALSLRVGITLLALGPLAVACNRIARKQTMAQLDHAINHDFLTGLLSRNAFFQRARAALAELSSRGAPMAMLVMDLDHFKQVNDRLGHPAGDDVLRQFSHVAASRLRGVDILGRMGGEEFLVLLPDVSLPQAQDLAQQICDAVRHHPFATTGHTSALQATVSIGLVHCPQAPTPAEIDALIHSADVQLYQAKQAGRDRVHCAPPVDTPSLPSEHAAHRTLHRRHATDLR